MLIFWSFVRTPSDAGGGISAESDMAADKERETEIEGSNYKVQLPSSDRLTTLCVGVVITLFMFRGRERQGEREGEKGTVRGGKMQFSGRKIPGASGHTKRKRTQDSFLSHDRKYSAE
jgi:hypothetical protein